LQRFHTVCNVSILFGFRSFLLQIVVTSLNNNLFFRQVVYRHEINGIMKQNICFCAQNMNIGISAYCFTMAVCLLKNKKCDLAKELAKTMHFIERTEVLGLLLADMPDPLAAYTVGYLAVSGINRQSAIHFYIQAFNKAKDARPNWKTDEELALYYHDLGVCCFHISRYIEGAEAFLQAKQICLINGSSSLKELLADVANLYGMCLGKLSLYVEAIKCHQEAINIRQSVCEKPRADDTLGMFYSNKGISLFYIQNYEAAKVSLELASRMRQASGNPSLTYDIAADLNQIGHCLFAMRKFEEALVFYQKAVNLRKQVPSDWTCDKLLAIYIANLGDCLLSLKKFSEAKRQLELAITIRTGSCRTSLIEVIGLIEEKIGDCLCEENDYREALLHYKRAANVRTLLGNHKNSDDVLDRHLKRINFCSSTIKMFAKVETKIKKFT